MDSADDPNDLDGPGSSNGLFSMSATENAEVVTPGVHLGGDGLWSVSAKTAVAGDSASGDDVLGDDDEFVAGYSEFVEEVVEDDIEEVQGEIVDGPDESSDFDGIDDLDADDDIWDVADEGASTVGDQGEDGFDGWDDAQTSDSGYRTDPLRSDALRSDPLGSVFTAEPVDRSDDVVDEPDMVDDDGFPVHDGLSSSLFSSGGTVGGAGLGAFPGTGAPYFTPAGGPARSGRNWEAGDEPPSRNPRRAEPLRSDPLWEETDNLDGPPGVSEQYLSQRDQGFYDDEDSPGYEAAILKLHPQDRERASVALSVAGALLKEGETVLGVVTGQMLGRPAAVVVTEGRVVVVNDRRWQPVVDVYKIDPGLRVRGRHDRNIAALSFSNDWSLSMVDGITEVSLAMDLAEQIRVIGDA